MDTAKTLSVAANANLLDFKPPTITMIFAGGVTDCMQIPIAALGIAVRGDVVTCTDPECEESSDDDDDADAGAGAGQGTAGLAVLQQMALHAGSDAGAGRNGAVLPPPESGSSPNAAAAKAGVVRISLDVSAMLAMCSEMCNTLLDPLAEKAKGAFKHQVLRDMLSQELESRAMEIILPAIEGKQLVVSPLALRTFKDIVASVGGPNEQKRADALLEQLEVGGDGVCSARVAALRLSGKIKAHSREIFGFGDATGMSTMTANTGFVRAAEGQGVKLSVVPLTCGGRALSELAERITTDSEGATP